MRKLRQGEDILFNKLLHVVLYFKIEIAFVKYLTRNGYLVNEFWNLIDLNFLEVE